MRPHRHTKAHEPTFEERLIQGTEQPVPVDPKYPPENPYGGPGRGDVDREIDPQREENGPQAGEAFHGVPHQNMEPWTPGGRKGRGGPGEPSRQMWPGHRPGVTGRPDGGRRRISQEGRGGRVSLSPRPAVAGGEETAHSLSNLSTK